MAPHFPVDDRLTSCRGPSTCRVIPHIIHAYTNSDPSARALALERTDPLVSAMPILQVPSGDESIPKKRAPPREKGSGGFWALAQHITPLAIRNPKPTPESPSRPARFGRGGSWGSDCRNTAKMIRRHHVRMDGSCGSCLALWVMDGRPEDGREDRPCSAGVFEGRGKGKGAPQRDATGV